jgi:DNA invertase Pin-like site-specific DNA recombinase
MSDFGGVARCAAERPQADRSFENREIDCVLVWKFDRFARSTSHLLAPWRLATPQRLIAEIETLATSNLSSRQIQSTIVGQASAS